MRDRLYSAVLILAAAVVAVLVFTSLRGSLRRIGAVRPSSPVTPVRVPPPPPTMPPPAPPSSDTSAPASGGAAASAHAPAGPEVFSGRILREDEKTPAAGASYMVTTAEAPSEGRWEAAADGRFTATGLRAGTIKVRAIAPGYAETAREFTVPQAPGETGTLVLPRPGPRVDVQACNTSGSPLGNTPLTLSLTWRLAEATRKATSRSATDAGGHIVIPAPPSATSVTIKAGDNYPPVTIETPSDTGIAYARLLPYGSFAVEGKVFCADGTPAQWAQVSLLVGGGGNPPMGAVCDQTGGYRIGRVPRGQITLRASGQKGEPSSPVTLAYDGAADLTAPRLKLGPGATLRVAVRGPGGPITSGVSVSAWTRPPGSRSAATSYASFSARQPASGGVHSVSGVLPGTWEVQVQAKDYEPGTAQAVLQSGKTTSATVTLKPLWTVSAKVITPDGTPMRNADAVVSYAYTHTLSTSYTVNGRVVSNSRFDETKTQRVKTDPRGGFTLRDLPSGGRWLSVTTREGSGEVKDLAKPASAGGKVQTVVRLRPPAAIEGLLVPKGVKLRSRGLAVVLFRGQMPRYEPLQEGWDELGASPDDPLDGTRMVFEPRGLGFRFDNIVPADGSWALCVVSPDVVSVPVPVQLSPGQTLSVELPATPPGRIVGSVVDARGRRVPGVPLIGRMPYEPRQMQQRLPNNAATDAHGRFVVENLPPGTWQVGCSTAQAVGFSEVKVTGGATSTVKVKLGPRQDKSTAGKR